MYSCGLQWVPTTAKNFSSLASTRNPPSAVKHGPVRSFHGGLYKPGIMIKALLSSILEDGERVVGSRPTLAVPKPKGFRKVVLRMLLFSILFLVLFFKTEFFHVALVVLQLAL